MAGVIEPQPYLEPQMQHVEAASATVATALTDTADKAEMMVVGHVEGSEGVIPVPGSQYAELGGVEPVNLISFAYQIASGMVRRI